MAMGRVTFQNTCQSLLPATTAASSRDGSMDRNGVAMSRNTMGVHRNPSTRIMPLMEKMLKMGVMPVTDFTAMLMNPASGPSNRIQPMTLTSPGTANDTNAAR